MAAVALLAIVSCTAVSCGSGTSKQGQSAPAAHATANSTVLEVDSLLKNAETLVGQPVVVEGVCTHICQHGGGKIFLMGSDDTQTIRIDAGEKVGKFTPETVNSLVRVGRTGKSTGSGTAWHCRIILRKRPEGPRRNPGQQRRRANLEFPQAHRRAPGQRGQKLPVVLFGYGRQL